MISIPKIFSTVLVKTIDFVFGDQSTVEQKDSNEKQCIKIGEKLYNRLGKIKGLL